MQEIIDNINSFIKDSITTVFADKKLILYVILLSLFFIIISFFTYNKFILPIIQKDHVLNKEFKNNQNNSKDILIIYFKTEWCPYCKKARPEWDKFVNYVNNINDSKTYDFQIITSVVDCDKQSSVADKYNVDAYPTIKLIKNKEIYEYDAKPNKEHLIEFLKSSINQ